MRVLVLGATSLIGNNVLREAVAADRRDVPQVRKANGRMYVRQGPRAVPQMRQAERRVHL
jgi:uncharacterized protein YbjT (DUF2867 family)